MLDSDIAVISRCVERVDDLVPVKLAAAGNAVAPPSDVGGLYPAYCLAEDSVAGAGPLVDLDVLGLDVADDASLQGVVQGIERVDAEPGQVGGVVGEPEAELGHPVPQLG